MDMLNRLKSFSTEQVDLEELVFLSSLAGSMRGSYEQHAIEAPPWLETRERELTREIASRVEEQRLKRRSEIKSRLEAMKPEGQKRRELQAELAKLEKQLED